jgi:tetratricopeptide (TPR) repeat protein
LVGCSSLVCKQKPAPIYAHSGFAGERVINTAITTPSANIQSFTTNDRQEAMDKLQAESSKVIVALLDAANKAHKLGKVEVSAATIERALRIDPRNALLFYKLAALKWVQDQPEQAIDLAKKSALLAEGNAILKMRNWTLIADIYEQQGDLMNANSAREKSTKFLSGYTSAILK